VGTRSRLGPILLAVVLASTALAGCSAASGSESGKFLVVTSVAPITDLAKNVAGNAATVEGLIPEGVDSHTFEPTPTTAKMLSQADLILLNGLDLEDPTLRLAEASHKDGAQIFLLGPHTITPQQYLYDFSFPKPEGHPNPHLWMDVANAITYTQLIRDELVKLDPAHVATYRRNAASYLTTLHQLDTAVQKTVDTIPPADRVLLTYHDSFAYFAHRYGMRVIGAIQPADFAEPSAQDVASLIDQIRAQHVPAIFGSEVFPSPVLAEIAKETGAKYEASLRDDDLPGDPGTPEHSYVGLIVYDVATMAKDLGGDPSAVESVSFTNRYD
jgi:ABC-type Zn uptake system ZnuABC Zn-binding protein ZnuA